MLYLDEGKGFEGRDPSFGDQIPPNNMRNNADSMQLGQSFDNRSLNGDSCNQRLNHLGSIILGPAETMSNAQGPRNGNSGTYASASHYQARMSGQSHSVSQSALPMPPLTNSRLVAQVPNGCTTQFYNPSLEPSGRFSESGIMMPWASNLGTSNRTTNNLNFFSNLYHESGNGGGFHNQRSLVPDQNGLPGFFDHTMPTTAHHGIPVNMARSLPFRAQLAHPVNNTHPGAYQFNQFQGQAANSSRHSDNQIGASQGQPANTSLRPGHQIGAPQLQPTPAVNHVVQAPISPAGTGNSLEIYFTSLGINSSGPFGQHAGRRSRDNQLPRLEERLSWLGRLRSSPNGLAATTFHNFTNLPTELRLMVWNCTIQRSVPRFIFFGYMNLPPAMAQVNMEARGVYKNDCKYYKLADTQRVTIYAPEQSMFLFKQYIPGLRLASPGEWSTVPVEMTSSPLPFGLLSVGQFVDTPIQPPDSVSSTWMSGVTSFAVPLRLAFIYFRRGAKRKADQNWKKLADMCPDLQEIFLISREGPSTTTTLDEMTEINEYELDNDSQEQHWGSQIIQGHRRNLQSGNTRDFVFKYVVFRP